MTSSFSSADYTPQRLQRMLADVITRRFPLSDIELLLRAGAEPDGPVTRGLRPLHYAAYENDVGGAELLIANGANVDASDDLGYTPLHVAAKQGHVEVARTLLDRGAAVNYGCNDEDNAIAGFRSPPTSTSTVQSMTPPSPDDDSEWTASRAAIVATDPVGLLTEQPLQLAIENDRRECAELLLSRGADPNRRYFLGRPINLVPLEHVDCLEVLLRHGADPDSFNRAGLTALMCAVKQNNVDAVRTLLMYGADVDAQCPPRFDRRRAIHFAAVTGSVEITGLLLDAGASTGMAPDYHLTPLDCAIQHDQLDICRILLEHGANPNEINGDGCSALQLVSSTPNLKHQRLMVELLLSAGARPNFASSTFSYVGPSLSALIEYLTYSESYDYGLVRLFLQYGARVSFRLPTRLLKIKDPCGLLGQLRKLRPHDDLLCLLVDAADGFDVDAIGRDSSLSNRQRQMLIECALRPRSLLQQSRRAVLDSLHGANQPPSQPRVAVSVNSQNVDELPVNSTTAIGMHVFGSSAFVDRLPLPRYLKRYIMFDVC